MTKDDLNKAAVVMAELTTEGTISPDIPVGESFIVMALESAGYDWNDARFIVDTLVSVKVLKRLSGNGIIPGERMPLIQASLAKYQAARSLG